MPRESGLAVFEQIPPKKQSSPSKNNSKNDRNDRILDLCEPRPAKRKRGKFIDEGELLFNCECEGCNYNTNKYYSLLKHLTEHAIEKFDEIELESDFCCIWSNCTYTPPNSNYFLNHLTYHGYHTRLRVIGNKILSEMKLPDCKEDTVKFPALPEYFTCEWENCGSIAPTYQEYVDHTKCHVNGLPKKSSEEEGTIQCGWAGCSFEFTIQFKLLDHIRSHTKEKHVACPTCGVMFSCKTKFYDHRKRQLSVELQGYQCSQCSKKFASERLLRDHMRIHINHYKCHLCDMTCTKPSTLSKHIRYRHLPERLFKCDICSHSTITLSDLNRHRQTHGKKELIECPSCTYKCMSKIGMNRHKKIHGRFSGPKYACHCCDMRFAMGKSLTKHLIRVHGFHWPSGHSRFSYKQDNKTGLYHLQVVRYESLEVTQEMIQDIDNIPYQFQNMEDCKFECVQNKPLSFVLKLSNTKKNDANTEQTTSKNVNKKDKTSKNK